MKNFRNINYAISLIILLIVFHSCKKEDKITVPILSTSSISGVTATSAKSGGIITSDGGATVISRGVCWSTNITPSIADLITTEGAGAGSFSSNLTGLIGGTTYFVRAYATNISGTGYGMTMSFTTLGEVPIATTQGATNVLTTTATINGSINPNYLSTIITFEYGLTTGYGLTVTASQSPVIGNSNTNVSAAITNLSANSTYHFRIKSVNSLGTTIGSDMTFTTLGQPPSASTLTATNVQLNAATLNATVNANYLPTTVTFEYGLTSSYGQSIASSQNTITGYSNISVNAEITSLTVATTYHFRVKAVNELGTTYGADITFKTFGQPPNALTQAATGMRLYSAILNGDVNANLLTTTVTFEYGLTSSYGQTISAIQNPIIGTTITKVTAILIGLSKFTTYHFRIKAENSAGTTIGNDLTFMTLDFLADYDGNIYLPVTIGSQVWMAENLKVTHYGDGSPIPNISDNIVWNNSTTGAFCYYNNDEAAYKNTYGALYNWYSTVDNRNICPLNWHIPTDADWTTLTIYLGGSNIAGGKMKEIGTAHWLITNSGVTNESGFTGLPGGVRQIDGFFLNGYGGFFWSSTAYNVTNAWRRYLGNGTPIYQDNYNKSGGQSIRCIKD